jgi:hypothetical protein
LNKGEVKKMKYIEITEETNDITSIPNMVRLTVDTDKEAEDVYNTYKDKINNMKARVIESEHNIDASKNKPCKVREFKEGKIEK